MAEASHARVGMRVAAGALEPGTEMCPAGSLLQDPLAHLPRRVMSDVLPVATGEISNPVPFCVLVKAGDGLLHMDGITPSLVPRAVLHGCHCVSQVAKRIQASVRASIKRNGWDATTSNAAHPNAGCRRRCVQVS